VDTSESMVTTKGWLRAGGKDTAVTDQQTKSSNGWVNLLKPQAPTSIPDMSPVNPIQQTIPHVAFTTVTHSYSQPLPFQASFTTSSLTLAICTSQLSTDWLTRENSHTPSPSYQASSHPHSTMPLTAKLRNSQPRVWPGDSIPCFDAILPTSQSPANSAPPTPYPPNLTPHPFTLCPHVLAQEPLLKWLPSQPSQDGPPDSTLVGGADHE
jgi:hypothetical protein